MYFVARLCPDPCTGGAYSTVRISIPEKVIKMSHGSLVHVGKKTLTDLQILGCELLQNVFGTGLRLDLLGEL